MPPPDCTVKQHSFGHLLPKHFFEAQGLRAQLHLIGAVGFGLAALVFHRGKQAASLFDNISNPGNTQRE